MKSKPRLKLEPVVVPEIVVPQIVAPEIMESAKRSMVDAGVRPLLISLLVTLQESIKFATVPQDSGPSEQRC